MRTSPAPGGDSGPEDALQRSDLVPYLLKNGLLTQADVVDCGIRLIDRSRSHRVTLATVAGGPSLAIKQAEPLAAASGRRLDREAAVHRLAGERPRLAAALPPLRHWDESRGVLVRDLVRPGETMTERRHRLGAPEPGLAAALGATLAAVHRSTAGMPRRPELRGEPPWALLVLERGRVEWAWEDPAMGAILAALPQPEVAAAGLSRAARHWHERCLVHGDVRSDNCLVEEAPAGEAGVKLVDWELAIHGDPAWDVACALAELAKPLGGTHVSRRTLWESYLRAARMMPGPAQRFAERTALYAGARLIQSAMEYGRLDGPRAPPVLDLLRLAVATLAEPGRHLPSLLGGAPTPSRERPGDCIPCAQVEQVA